MTDEHGGVGGVVNTSGCGPEERGSEPRTPPQDIGAVLKEAVRRKFPGMIEEEEAAREALRQPAKDRDELRAILAPMLDDPIDEYDGMECWCKFCRADGRMPSDIRHRSSCPVLDRDRLLGRQPPG